MDYMQFSEMPDNEERERNREFLREGVVGKTCLAARERGAIVQLMATVFTPEAFQQFRQALLSMEARLNKGETLGTVELYENGMNVFVRRPGLDGSAGVYRWRVKE